MTQFIEYEDKNTHSGSGGIFWAPMSILRPTIRCLSRRLRFDISTSFLRFNSSRGSSRVGGSRHDNAEGSRKKKSKDDSDWLHCDEIIKWLEIMKERRTDSKCRRLREWRMNGWRCREEREGMDGFYSFDLRSQMDRWTRGQMDERADRSWEDSYRWEDRMPFLSIEHFEALIHVWFSQLYTRKRLRTQKRYKLHVQSIWVRIMYVYVPHPIAK